MERYKTGIFPKGWRRGLPLGLDLDTARTMTGHSDVSIKHLVYKATGNMQGQSNEYLVGVKRTPMLVPGAIDGVSNVYLGPEVEAATARNS